VTDWTASCRSHYQHHRAPPQHHTADPWMLNARQHPYVYSMKAGAECDSAGRHVVRFPRCDVAAAAAAGCHEPAFVDCSYLFTSHQRHQPSSHDDSAIRLHGDSTTDLQKDMWTAADYQLNHHSSQYTGLAYTC